jgi:WD40 repeat protein
MARLLNVIVVLSLRLSPLAAQAPDPKAVIDGLKTPPTPLVEKLKDIPISDRIFSPEVAFAAQWGPFVAGGGQSGFDPATITVVSLADGKVVGKVTTKEIAKVALSPSGKFIAGIASTFKADTVNIFDTKTGKPVGKVAVPKHLDAIRFLSEDRITTSHTWEKTVVVWDITTGKEVKRFDYTNENHDGIHAVTPGGNWIVMPKGETLLAMEINGNRGVEIGTVHAGQNAHPKALAFSPDGKRLAVLFNDFRKSRMTILNLETGVFSEMTDVEHSIHNRYAGPMLEATADGLGWLAYGDRVHDGVTGIKIWQLNDDQRGELCSRAVAINQVMAASGSHRAKRILAVVVAKDKMDEIRKIASAGGDVRDAMLPKATATTIAGAKIVDTPLGGVTWGVTLPAATGAAALAAKPFPIGVAPNSIGAVMFSDATAGVVAFERRKEKALHNDTTAVAIESYSLMTGKPLAKMPLPTPGMLMSVAGDGKSLIVLDAEKKERLDLVSQPDGKPLAAWRPYDKGTGDDRKVAQAFILDEGRVLTLNSGGVLIVWAVPAMKAEVMTTVPNLKRGRLSADRKLLIGVDRDTVRVFDARTLAALGDGETLGAGAFAGMTPVGVAVREDGQQIAAIFKKGEHGWGSVVRFWDAKSGKLLGEIDSPVNINGFRDELAVQFAGKFILAGHQALIDTATKSVVWWYPSQAFFETRLIPEPPDDRLWLAGNTFGNHQVASIAAVRIPEPAAVKIIDEVQSSKDAVLKPGSKLSMKVDGEGDQLNVIRDGVVASADAALKRAGHSSALGSAGDAVLMLNFKENATGKTEEYRMFGINRGTLSVNVIELVCTPSIEQQGRVIWRGEPAKYTNASYFIHVPRDEKDVTEFLRKRMWQTSSQWAAGLLLPHEVVNSPQGLICLPGSTKVTPTGLQTTPPKAVR